MTAIHYVRAAGLALLVAAPAPAQQRAPSTVETLRLTPDEKADIVAHQTEATVESARAGLGGTGRQIHGEIGATIGTGGTRDIYGTAAIPLGDHAGAVLSFERGRYGPRY